MQSVTVKGHPGIRKKENGKYLAAKSIKRKKYYEEFKTLREAANWKNEFHPLISPNPLPRKTGYNPTVADQGNGKDKDSTLRDIWDKYQKNFMGTLSDYTQYRKQIRMAKFLPNLYSVRICQITPDVIIQHIEDMKLIVAADSKRCNFDKELKDLSAIFSWYSQYQDFTYHNPVKRFHFKLAKLKDIEPKKKDMSVDQFLNFLDRLEEPFQSLALIQTYLAGRIQEAAALNDRTVDFTNRRISITEKIVWMKGKPDHKFGTKTGVNGSAVVDMNVEMFNRLHRLKLSRPKGCKYFFHHKGKVLRYEMIRKAYNKALLEAGLEEFSGTNILRHTMATLSRKIAGLDASQAMLRHVDSRMTEGYAKLDVNEKVSNVVIRAEELFNKARVTRGEVGVTASYQVDAVES